MKQMRFYTGLSIKYVVAFSSRTSEAETTSGISQALGRNGKYRTQHRQTNRRQGKTHRRLDFTADFHIFV